MIPGYLRDLDDYWVWIERLIDQSGGYFDGPYLIVEPVSIDDDGRPPWLALEIRRQRIRFLDGSYLSFELAVSLDFESLDYSYHYAGADNKLRWRHDKHLGHELEDGGPTHAHLADGRRVAEDDVDLNDVLKEIMADLARRAETPEED